MNQKPQLTLKEVQASLQLKRRTAGVSDFLTEDEKRDLQGIRQKNKRRQRRKKAKFDKVDAYIAEIIARFGYDAYCAWNNDEIDDQKMLRLLEAERARERSAWLPIEGLLRALIQGGVPTYKPKKSPKIRKEVPKILQDEVKRAKGEI